MRKPSSRMRNERVTLLRHEWGKDADGGRRIISTVTILNAICSVEASVSNTLVDETGRWTTEQPYALRFTTNPGLDAHDEIIWVDEGDITQTHKMVVLGTTNRMGRDVTYEVSAIERV